MIQGSRVRHNAEPNQRVSVNLSVEDWFRYLDVQNQIDFLYHVIVQYVLDEYPWSVYVLKTKILVLEYH